MSRIEETFRMRGEMSQNREEVRMPSTEALKTISACMTEKHMVIPSCTRFSFKTQTATFHVKYVKMIKNKQRLTRDYSRS